MRFGWLAGVAALALNGTALAAGYAVGVDSVSGLGLGFSNGAQAGDASVIWANPAGMTKLDRSEVVGGAGLILPRLDFENEGSVLFNGAPIPGGDGGNGAFPSVIPNLYGVYVASPELRFGLGLNAPYGLVTDWDPNGVTRYNEVTTSLKTFNVNPAVAYRALPGLSLGAGVNLTYADARLLQAIDFGSLCAAA
jgi:long-chain fatty acid transport protein